MRRLLAILGAVAMVALAIIIRRAIDDDDASAEDRRAVVICATDLAEVCAALDDVDVELADAADTAALIASGDTSGIDGWVTTTAWVELVTARAPDIVRGTALVARTPVQVAADPVRAEAISGLCGDQPILGCLGEHAGSDWGDLGGDRGWGDLKTGLPDADGALGLGVLPAVAGGFFGHLDFAANDFDAGDFRGWLDRLAQPSGRGDRDPASTLVTRQGTYSAAVSTEARLEGLSRPVERFGAIPPVDVTVVVAFLSSDDVDIDLAPLREVLEDLGWARATGDLVPILKDGVLAALHTLWTEVTR